MSSRMEKYEFDSKTISKRTEKNADLYIGNEESSNYNKIDINSNVSVLKTDIRDIDVNQIRDMLDKKYRDNIPRRKSIDIPIDDTRPIPEIKIETKEYDINQILEKAKSSQEVDYEKERLKKVRDTNYDILDKLELDKEKEPSEGEKNLLNLINTINELESKSVFSSLKSEDKTDDLLNLTDDNATEILEPTEENSFYTGSLAVDTSDYDQFDDFNDIQTDIKSNSKLINVLIFIFVLIVVGGVIFFLNKFLGLGLF